MADSAGKGVFYITIANALFFLTSFAISLILARILLLEEFGLYGVILSLVSTANLVFVNGFKQSVSKFVSEEGCLSKREKWTLFFGMLGVGFIMFAVLFFGAPIAAGLLNDAALVPLIRIISPLVLTYAVYSFFTGYLNGLRGFKFEAALRVLYGFLKLFFIIGLAAITMSVFYAFAGFVLASIVIVAVGYIVFRKVNAETREKIRQQECSPIQFFKFALPLFVFVLITNILLSLDLWMIKALFPPSIANVQAAYYTVASTISRLSFYAVMALTAVLLPIVSHLSHYERFDKVRLYIRNANRYTIMLLAPIVVLLSVKSTELCVLLFGEKFAAAGLPLSILAFGLGFFALFSVLAAIVSGHGKPKIVTIISIAALMFDFALNYILIPVFGLFGAAIATTVSLFFALLVLSVYVWFTFKAFCAIKSIAKIVFAAFIAYVVAVLIPFSGFAIFLVYGLAGFVYFGVLVFSGELSQKDFTLVKAIFFTGD